MSKFLIIGLGSAGRRAMALLHELRPDAHLLVADPFAPPRPSAPHTLYYRDWSKMVEDHGDADAVLICSPTENHLRQLGACLERNLPTFCEKPLITAAQYTKADWRWLEKYDSVALKCAVNFQYRFDPGVAWSKNYIYERQPVKITFTGQDDLLIRYGPNVDEIMCAHPIDTARYLLGDVTAVDLESDGVNIRGSTTHELGTSYYNFRMDRGPRTSYLTSHRYKTELGDPFNYRNAIACWVSWLEGLPRDRMTATLADGLAVSAVLAQVRQLEHV